MPPFYLSHVALVVTSLDRTRSRLEPLSPRFAEIEDQPSEGTREQYVEIERAAPLLLCESSDRDGPYARALAKRGPGLHHIGLSVADLAGYVGGLAGSGWYALPQSLRTFARGVVWLARPGVGTLVEVCEMPETAGSPFVSLVEIPMERPRDRLLSRLGLPDRPLLGVTVSPDRDAWLTIGGRRMSAAELASE